ALLMRGGESARDLDRVVQGLADRQWTCAQTLAQRVALEQLGDHVGRAGVLTDVVHRENVWMIERRGGARFLLEAVHALAVRSKRREDNLDRDVARETRIARAIDLAHAAGPEQSQDLVGAETSAG